jgi:cell wall-associated NlpC family hydrolase
MSRYHSPLGLNGHQRQRARDIAVFAAVTAYRHRQEMIYTEGAARWSGINDHRLGYKHEFPRAADCSAFVTWCLWNACEHFHIRSDIVNGAMWQAGYTGTMVEHGQRVSLDRLLPGDAVFYAGTPQVPQHTAIYIGSGRVVSHGQQGDPSVLPVDLGLPINQARRYIR